jgi:hypothetical protein
MQDLLILAGARRKNIEKGKSWQLVFALKKAVQTCKIGRFWGSRRKKPSFFGDFKAGIHLSAPPPDVQNPPKQALFP